MGLGFWNAYGVFVNRAKVKGLRAVVIARTKRLLALQDQVNDLENAVLSLKRQNRDSLTNQELVENMRKAGLIDVMVEDTYGKEVG